MTEKRIRSPFKNNVRKLLKEQGWAALNQNEELRLFAEEVARNDPQFAQLLDEKRQAAGARKQDLKAGLSAWAEAKAIRPVDFAARMNYTPAYAWSLLRGAAPVTVACLGQFVLVYGGQEAETLLALANRPNDGDLAAVAGAQA